VFRPKMLELTFLFFFLFCGAFYLSFLFAQLPRWTCRQSNQHRMPLGCDYFAPSNTRSINKTLGRRFPGYYACLRLSLSLHSCTLESGQKNTSRTSSPE